MTLMRPTAKTPPGAGLDLVAPRQDGYLTSRELARQDARLGRHGAGPPATGRPVLTLGPYFFLDIAASATQDGRLSLPSAAATYGTTTSTFAVPLSGRVVGGMGLISGAISSGTLTMRAKIDSAYTDIAGTTITAGVTTMSAWLGWDHGISFARGALVLPALLSASLSPTTLEATVLLYVMLDTRA